MFQRFKNASLLQKVKKIAIPVGVAALAGAGYQGWTLRNTYNKNPKLDAPSGPTAGLERWIDKARAAKEDLLTAIKADDNVMSRGIHKVKDILEDIEKKRTGKDKIPNTVEGSSHVACDKGKRKTVRLIVIGDSLVAGVGNDDPLASPALPQLIATTLSKKLKADVIWLSSGIIGGTVVDLREKALQDIRTRMDRFQEGTVSSGDVEYVVVIMCGLNDWKSVFINFPTGLWPSTFNSKLTGLVQDIVKLCSADGSNCRVFLPNLPLACFHEDPKYIMGVKPLSYFVDAISYLYDTEKLRVAAANKEVTHHLHMAYAQRTGILWLTNALVANFYVAIRICLQVVHFVGSPEVDSDFATPGLGNVSSDGVHPSTQGCT
jgi:hypothetical protein